ncbi:hypothetical protein AABB24_035631 [Solanum stoloniferum]|uniref:Uncharacterized protein n=1 Tax=Solanum stoloniferum TaxID=62892 RepID=A0ABD2RAY8_9SOLN
MFFFHCSLDSIFHAQSFLQTPMPEPYSKCNQLSVSNTMFGLVDGSSQKQEGAFHVEKSLVSHPDLSTKDTDQLFPESLLDFEKVHHLANLKQHFQLLLSVIMNYLYQQEHVPV